MVAPASNLPRSSQPVQAESCFRVGTIPMQDEIRYLPTCRRYLSHSLPTYTFPLTMRSFVANRLTDLDI